MSRSLTGSVFLAVFSAVGYLVLLGGGVANAVPANLGSCVGDQVGSTFTLTADCTTTVQIDVPATTTTVKGAGHTITAKDTTPGTFNGAVLNSATDATMNVENLNIVGQFTFGGSCVRSLVGILFNNASGTVDTVTVNGISEKSGCQTGLGIRANGFAAPMHTVTITDTTVTDYDKNGLTGSGAFMTMDVSGSTVGPPASLVGTIAQNGTQWGGAFPGTQGSIKGSKIFGSGDDVQGASGTAILLFGAKNVTVDNNTITGAGTDDGIFVTNTSTGIVISHNKVGRTSADNPDPDGVGIAVCSSTSEAVAAVCGPENADSSATLICNTFSNWNKNIVGAVQVSCTPLAKGTECHAYSDTTLSVQGGTAPFTWSVSAGTLPPGLTLAASNGAITGTPTKAGTFDFTVKVVDSTDPPLTATQAQTITIAADCATPAPSTPAPAPSTSSAFVPGPGATGDSQPDSPAPWLIALAALGILSAGSLATLRRRRKHS